MRRVLVRLLVLVLVPVTLVFGTQLRASAEIWTSPSVGAQIYVDGAWQGYGPMECEGLVETVVLLPTATEPGTTSVALDDWECTSGGDRSPFSCQPAEQGCPFKAWVKGSQCFGSLSGDLGPSEHDGLDNVGGTFSGAYGAGDHRCDPASVCVRAEGGGSFREGCTPINLDPPDYSVDSSGTCNRATFQPTTHDGARLLTGGNTYRQWAAITRWAGQITSVPSGGHGGPGWYIYAVIRKDGTSDAYPTIQNSDAPAFMSTGQDVSTDTVGSRHVAYMLWTPAVGAQTWAADVPMSRRNHVTAGAPDLTGTITGFGLIGTRTTTLNWYATPSSQPTSGRLGLTIPTECTFYWGEKIANVVNSETDEPLGPVGGAAEPPHGPPGDPQPVDCEANPEDPACEAANEDCDFQLTDPSTWLNGGMCVVASGIGGLVKAIKRLVSALKDLIEELGSLAADIAAALLEGLVGLFVPGAGFFEDKVQEVKDAWDGTPPGEIVETAADLPSAFSGSGQAGCAGPTINLDLPMTDGTTALTPFSTCRPGVATVAGVVKVALQVIIWLGAFLVGVRLLLSALGYQTSFGKGDD